MVFKVRIKVTFGYGESNYVLVINKEQDQGGGWRSWVY